MDSSPAPVDFRRLMIIGNLKVGLANSKTLMRRGGGNLLRMARGA